MPDANVSVSFSASVSDFVSGVDQAKSALQSFSAPFGEINAHLASLATASSQAFSADRLTPYRDALSATRALEQSIAADRQRAAAALNSGDDRGYADAIHAAQAATAEEVRLVADAAQQKIALYAQEARSHQISESERVTLSREAIEEEYSAEVAAVQRRAALGSETLLDQQRIDNLLIDATRRREDQISDLMRSSMQEQERAYESFATSVEQTFNSQLRGLISGTTSWRTAFSNVLESMLVKFIEWTESTVAHYLIGEATKTPATTAGVAARTGVEQAGAATSMASQAATMIRSIVSSAAETFAGVFGFLSPLMGPLAVGPATAAQATVAGMAGAVASADIGMWQVPQDMLTLVHHNELIMPAAEAGAFRTMLTDGGASAGGASVHIHPTTNVQVSALDSGSVSQWMRGNSGTMLKAVDEAVRHGARIGLRRLGG